MEGGMEQGVGDAAHHLLSATRLGGQHFSQDGRGLRLDHGYGEEEEGFAKLGENHFPSWWRWLSLRNTGLLRGPIYCNTGATFRCSLPFRSIQIGQPSSLRHLKDLGVQQSLGWQIGKWWRRRCNL